MKCPIEGCPKEICKNGMCRRHSNQIYKYGKIIGNPSKSYRDPNTFIEFDNYIVVETNDVWGNTNGQFIVDKEDWIFLKKFKWNIDVEGYPSTTIKQKTQRLHSFLLTIDRDKKEVIDHKDRNKLNNRRINLRICSPLQNYLNSKQLRSDNKSGYIGVTWNDRVKKWISYIGINGKRKHLGYFSDKQEAALVRDRVAFFIWGKNAKLNFQEGGILYEPTI